LVIRAITDDLNNNGLLQSINQRGRPYDSSSERLLTDFAVGERSSSPETCVYVRSQRTQRGTKIHEPVLPLRRENHQVLGASTGT